MLSIKQLEIKIGSLNKHLALSKAKKAKLSEKRNMLAALQAEFASRVSTFKYDADFLSKNNTFKRSEIQTKYKKELGDIISEMNVALSGLKVGALGLSKIKSALKKGLEKLKSIKKQKKEADSKLAKEDKRLASLEKDAVELKKHYDALLREVASVSVAARRNPMGVKSARKFLARRVAGRPSWRDLCKRNHAKHVLAAAAKAARKRKSK